jgi:ribosomal protein L11 methyltransferase
MSWLALSLELDAAVAEAFSEALLEAGALSVTLEEAAPEWRRQRVTALFEPHAAAPALVEEAAQACGIASPPYSTSPVEDQDWVRKSQSQFEPFQVGEALWIGPNWLTPPAKVRASVRLDPGLAFGTGSHPTTRLVLRYLAGQIHGGERVLDYGCGSGILAIAAAKLGASQVDAVDIDPQAVETAAANAALNEVAVRSLAAEALAPGLYEIVVSNILAQPLIVLAPLLAARTAPGGRLALSGILQSQAAEVAAAYANFFAMNESLIDEGWALVTGIRT